MVVRCLVEESNRNLNRRGRFDHFPMKMATEFQNVLNFRKFFSMGTNNDIQIKCRTNQRFKELLEDALDQLYKERCLEDGKCIVCQNKTSKCCSLCGTHYCSVACQSEDWLNHKSTCSSFPETDQKMLNGKPTESENKITNHIMNDHGLLKKGKPHLNRELKLTSNHSSYQDVSVAGRSTEDEESSRESNKENPKNGQQGHFKRRRFKSKPFGNPENGEKSENGKRRKGFKKYSPLQKIQVKRMITNRDHYWVIEKSDAEKFEKIQKTLELEWKTYPMSYTPPDGFFGMKFNNIWHRCKILAEKPKLLIRCVDTGRVFCPKHISCLELPEHLKEEEGLAFRVVFKDLNMPGEEEEWLNVQVLGVLPNGSYEMTLCEDKKKKKEDLGGQEADTKQKKANKKKNKWPGDMRKNRENSLCGQSVIDELKVSTKGVFLPTKITKDSMLGCLAPDDVSSAMFYYNSITELYIEDGHIVEGVVGDCVMVAGDDTTGHRGVILSKTEKTYQVRLIDYGYEVETEKVYKLPEKLVGMMELACSVTLLENPPCRYDEFEVKRAYVMEVMEKNQNGDWVCKFSTYPDLQEVFAMGTVNKPWKRKREVYNYVPFEDGDTVLITGVGSENDVHIKHVSIEKWDQMLEDLNLKLNTGPQTPDLRFEDVKIGDIILSKYDYDGLWYRGKVLQKKKDRTVKVVFVDYGNFQISCESQLRKLPHGINDPFFSMKVTLVGPGNPFTTEGRNYLTRMRDNRSYVTMVFNGEDISNGVFLYDEDGTELNKTAFTAEPEPCWEPNSSLVGFNKEKFLKSQGFEVGSVENFTCLYVERDLFFKTGVFWAVNMDSKDFKNVVEMGDMMSKCCESNPKEYSPEVGDLCIAHYLRDWYRGHIVNKFGHFFEIFFVDFGNSQLIEPWNIRKMEPEFFKVPAIASKCLISKFSKLEDKEILNIYTFLSGNLNQTINNKAVVVKVTGVEHYVEFKDI